jgi:hypothetical protein
MFDVEISGSKTVKHTVKNFIELKRIARRANGNISVSESNIVTFYGTPQQLLNAIEIAEYCGKNTLYI